MSDMPDRLSVDPDSPYYDEELLQKGIGIRFKGEEKRIWRLKYREFFEGIRLQRGRREMEREQRGGAEGREGNEDIQFYLGKSMSCL